MKNNYMEMEPLEVYNLVLEGTLKKFPSNYLDKNAVKELVRYVVLDKYKLDRATICTLTKAFFSSEKLGGARKLFDFGVNQIIVESFPEMNIKYWELTKVRPKFWSDVNNQKEFVLWVAEKENLDVSKKEDLRKITAELIIKHGGKAAFSAAGSMFKLLNTVANNKYMEWEISEKSAWCNEEVIQAVKWLVEEKLVLTPEEACKLKAQDFIGCNLDGMLQKKCNHSVWVALEMAYPGIYIKNGRKIVLAN